MTITRLHIGITVLIALAIHGGVVLWLVLSSPAPPPPSPAPSLRVSLLAVVADQTVNAVSQPIVEPVPVPQPRPVVQEALVKPQPLVEPVPEPQPPVPGPVNELPEIEQPPEPAQEIVQPPLAAPDAAEPLDAVATAQYEQLLVAWLEKHKKYPRRAKRLRIEGRGMLRIRIDSTGRIQQVTLEQRTGNRLLDEAALDMAQRADPFPPIPENDPRRELEFIIPVVFALR